MNDIKTDNREKFKMENIMNWKRSLGIISIVLLFLLSSVAFGQKGDYSNYKGYVDFGNLAEFENGDDATEVLIEEHLLKMVAKMAGKEEEELSNVLSGIKLIKVNTFGVSDNDFLKLSKVVKKIDKELMQKGWDRIVKTRSKDEFTSVFILTNGEEKIKGLVVTSIEKGGEASFVNIVGDINLETIGELGDKFDIPSIDEFKKDNPKNDSTKMNGGKNDEN